MVVLVIAKAGNLEIFEYPPTKNKLATEHFNTTSDYILARTKSL